MVNLKYMTVRTCTNCQFEHEAIDDGTSGDEEVNSKRNNIKHVNAIKYFTSTEE